MATSLCPETPRQKMIGMMYLFYTALLALNVSAEIINAFVLVDESLQKTTINFYEKTQGLYNKLNVLKSQQPEKYAATWDEAIKIKERSDELVNDVQRLKVELVKYADGEDGDINNIQKKNSLDAGPELMIGETGPKKGDSLRNWVEDYRAFMIGYIEDTAHEQALYHNLESNLATNDDLDNREEPKTWQERLFEGMPLVGSITMMTKLQADIRNSEADLVERLIRGVDELDITITDIEAVVNAPKSYIIRGGDYEASVFIAARDTSMKPTVYYSTKYPFYDTVGEGKYEMRGSLGEDYDTLPLVDGKGTRIIENCVSVGTYQWGGLIKWSSKQGDIMLPYSTEYMIGEAGYAISPTGLNVFYRGIDNPVEISVSGYPKENVHSSIRGGARFGSVRGQRVVRITSNTTRNVSISVSVGTDEGIKHLGTKKFRVLNVPVPPAKLNGTKAEGRVHKNDIMNGILLADLGDQFFPFDVDFTVVSFRFTYKVRGQTRDITVRGNKLNSEARSALQSLGRGTRISFETVRVKGPSGVFQTAPISLELR